MALISWTSVPTLREQLIAEGLLVPAELVPDRVGEGLPYLPIDDRGREVAAHSIGRRTGDDAIFERWAREERREERRR
jgi:hypothetical protein